MFEVAPCEPCGGVCLHGNALFSEKMCLWRCDPSPGQGGRRDAVVDLNAVLSHLNTDKARSSRPFSAHPLICPPRWTPAGLFPVNRGCSLGAATLANLRTWRFDKKSSAFVENGAGTPHQLRGRTSVISVPLLRRRAPGVHIPVRSGENPARAEYRRRKEPAGSATADAVVRIDA